MSAEILQVITDTDRRGAQVFATDLHDALRLRGRSVRTIALTSGETNGLDVPVLGRRPLGLATLRALRREIRSARVVIGHGSTTLPACALASAATKTPFVYRQISDSLFWASTRLRRARVRAGMSRAAKIVALWTGSAETLRLHFGVAADDLVVIPNGVPVDRFPEVERSRTRDARRRLGLDPDCPTVVYLGALVPEKGVDLAIEAVAGLDGTQLLVVGAGPERPRLEDLAAKQAPDRITFCGSLPEPGVAFGAADVVVLASRGGDSMPAVLIEASLSGVPVVATPVEGIPEIVLNGRTGLLAPIGSPEGVRASIARIVEDTDLGVRLGQEARRHCIARFSIDHVASRWDEALTQVMTRRPEVNLG
jgi:glycosyltransferase involved in cell wall biosynthesis